MTLLMGSEAPQDSVLGGGAAQVSEMADMVTPRTSGSRPCVLVLGPGAGQVGGVATFTQILLASPVVLKNYKLIHIDTTRAADDLPSTGMLSLRNLRYLLGQMMYLFMTTLKLRPRLMHLPVTSYWSFWKSTAFIVAGKALGIKVIAHLHGGLFDKFYRERSIRVRRVIGWVLARADIVIALSGRWKSFLLEEVRSDLRIEVLPNTVDYMFAQALEQVDGSPARTNNMVLFVGGLGQRKGVFEILRAVELVRAERSDVVFLFAGGDEQPGASERIAQYCKEAHLGQEVRFLGPVTGEAKAQLYRQAAIFILPSHGENLPYALLEALAAGLPVVTTPVGAIPEIVEHGRHGYLITPGDHVDLARRIVELLGDPALRERMSLANVQLIRDSYLPDVAMARLAATYDRLLGVTRERAASAGIVVSGH